MDRRIPFALAVVAGWVACSVVSEPVGTAKAQLEGGSCECSTEIPLGGDITGESLNDHLDRPVSLLRWDVGWRGDNVLTLGSSTPTLARHRVHTLTLDAKDRVAFQTLGVTRMALRQHATLHEPLLYLTLNHVWFANGNYADSLIKIQGINVPLIQNAESKKAEDDPTRDPERTHGFTLKLEGQAVYDTGPGSVAQGGDLVLQGGAGDAEIARGGDVVIRGGNTGINVSGGVQIESKDGIRLHEGTPTSTPTSGGYLYSEGGALYWRGSAGTVTRIAPP